MKFTSKLSIAQIKQNRRRSLWTLLGIILSTAMLTAVTGFVACGDVMFKELIGDNYYSKAAYTTTLIGLGVILGSIIVFCSVVVVSNAFRISAGERTRQFGILKSVGATKRQIAAIVVKEGILLSVIGIPVGILLGLLVEYIGVLLSEYFLAALNNINKNKLELRFVLSYLGIGISAVVAFGTVMLSAWLPAKKAAKIPAIEAIRGQSEVKILNHRVRSNPLISLLFGYEGTLASKSVQRSRRSFRATVLSLTISIVLFISASSIGMQAKKATNMYYPTIDATAAVSYSTSVVHNYDENGEIESDSLYAPLSSEIADIYSERLNEHTQIFGLGFSTGYHTTLPKIDFTSDAQRILESDNDHPESTELTAGVNLIVTDPVHYVQLCERAGVPAGSNILINRGRETIDGKHIEYDVLNFSNQILPLSGRDEQLRLPIQGELTGDEVPNELLYSQDIIKILVPSMDCAAYYWFANTEDSAGFCEYAKAQAEEILPQADNKDVFVEFNDLAETMQAVRNTANLLMVFIYGFVGMLTLIASTNVISTITENIRSRKREFAVLQSIGMTRNGLRKMMNLESILCSLRSLIIGLPLGVAASYGMYEFIMKSVEFPYEFPLLAVIEVMLGVFAITWITMRYTVSRIKSDSIVETIRLEADM